MFSNISIFDFDRTLTIRHTFSLHCLDGYPIPYDHKAIYEDGKKNALRNMKIGAAEYLRHDRQQLSAIASYHNNPTFIAGFVSGLLGKELTFEETIISNSDPVVAIDSYVVEGEEAPFLICYIPAIGGEFMTRKNALEGKNNQLAFLRQIFMEKRLGTVDAINFFDDTEENFNQAKKLPFVKSHLIDGSQETFTVLDTFYSGLELSKEFEDESRLDRISEDVDAKLLPKKIDAIHQPISAGFFMQIMTSKAAKIVGGLLLIAGLAALTAGILGIASIAAMIGGAAASALGLGVLSCGFFAQRSSKVDSEAVEQQKLMRASI